MTGTQSIFRAEPGSVFIIYDDLFLVFPPKQYKKNLIFLLVEMAAREDDLSSRSGVSRGVRGGGGGRRGQLHRAALFGGRHFWRSMSFTFRPCN